jgi:transposase
MKLHANAPLGPKGRAIMVRRIVEEGRPLMEAAEAAGMSGRRAAVWSRRYRAQGEAGLHDRSSAPKTVANRTDERRTEAIAALRRVRMTGAEIAEVLEMAPSTVSGILTRIGLGKLSRLAARARQPLRAQAGRRAAPHRRQKAGQDRPWGRTPDDWQADQAGPRDRLGVRPRLR